MKGRIFMIILLVVLAQSCDNADAAVLFKITNESKDSIRIHAKSAHKEVKTVLQVEESMTLQLLLQVTTSPTVDDSYFSWIEFDTIQISQNGNLIEKDFLDREHWKFENHEQDFGIYELVIEEN
ncbi:MAG: hypothetical protein AAGG75_14850 [Bacteroidota bacterium]